MRISDWSSDVCSSDRDYHIKRYTDDRHTSRSPLDQSTQPTFRHGEASAWRRYPVQGPGPHGYRGILHFRRLGSRSRWEVPGSSWSAAHHQIERASGSLVRESSGRRYRKPDRSEEHTSELQSLMRISYAVFCLKKKTQKIVNIIK